MALTENKELLQIVFDSVSNGIAVLQAIYDDHGSVEDFSILLLNAHILSWTGDIAYQGRRYGDVFPVVKETGVLKKFIEVVQTGAAANFENSFLKEGVNRWFRFMAVKHDQLLVVSMENITERKQMEILLANALEAAEKQKHLYDSITNNIPDLVYVFDLNYRFTYANEALLAMWGKSAEDAIGKGLRENGYEEWHALMHEREIDAVVATKKAIRGTVSFPHAEQGIRVYDYIFSPVFNEAGEVEAVAGSTRDITEIKQTEDSLQRSEARFRNMIEQAPIAILLTKGEDVVIESVNRPMLQFMNKTAIDEVLGKKMLDVLPELAGQKALQIVIDVQRTGVSFRGNDQPVDLLINGELQRRYFNFSYDLIKESADSSAVMHMAIDVTDQVLARKKIEESETRLKSVIDQTPAPTLVLRGDDLVIEQINQHMLLLIGQGPEIIGRPLIDVLPELEGQYVWNQVKRVYNEGISFDQTEVLVRHSREGVVQDHYYNLAYRPRKENGQITGMIQVAIDVTEQVIARKKLEESEARYRALSETLEQQVNDRTKELQRSNEDLQQFAHVASHDLKEPVRKIKMFIDRLQQTLSGTLNANAVTYIEKINIATDRMFSMIDGVLTYSTTNASRQKSEPVDLNEIIRSIETDLDVTLHAAGASIQSGHLPVLEGAPVLLYQLFYNLIKNSIKFVAPGTAPRITISSEQVLQNNEDHTRIILEDNGIGFEAIHAQHIFDTFTRLNPKDKYEGTGLGLSLCKKIAERHGGSISASGIPGNGATFTIFLPMQQKQTGI